MGLGAPGGTGPGSRGDVTGATADYGSNAFEPLDPMKMEQPYGMTMKDYGISPIGQDQKNFIDLYDILPDYLDRKIDPNTKKAIDDTALGKVLGFVENIPGISLGVVAAKGLVGIAKDVLSGNKAKQDAITNAVAITGMNPEQAESMLDAAIDARRGAINTAIANDGGLQQVLYQASAGGVSYGNWWERDLSKTNMAYPGRPGGNPMPNSTWIKDPSGSQYFLSPEMMTPGYSGPIVWGSGKHTYPQDPQDPRNAMYVINTSGGTGAGTSIDTSKAAAKADPWDDFLNKYYGIDPSGTDPGQPSLYDRVLADVTFKQDEANEFLTQMQNITNETVGGLQSYQNYLKQQVQNAPTFNASFGPNAPMQSFTLPSTNAAASSYADMVKDISVAQEKPATLKLGMADLLSPEKGHLDYMKNHQDFIKWLKEFGLKEYAAEQGIDLKQQEIDKAADQSDSWMSFIDNIIGIGKGATDLWSAIKKG